MIGFILCGRYNSTGEPFRQSPEAAYFVEEVADEEDEDEMSTEAELKKKKKKKKKKGPPKPGDRYCRRKKNRSLPICQPRLPRHADKNSPSRKNGFGTPLGYAQVCDAFFFIQGSILFLLFITDGLVWLLFYFKFSFTCRTSIDGPPKSQNVCRPSPSSIIPPQLD